MVAILINNFLTLYLALTNRAAFPALRKAAYQCTIQLITAYRSAVEKLMAVSPLADHVDLKDHYIAFIELESFGIEEDWQQTMESMKGEEISVKMLKDTVQVALVQQSEYLRRFGLVFCESVRYNSNFTLAIFKYTCVFGKMGS